MEGGGGVCREQIEELPIDGFDPALLRQEPEQGNRPRHPAVEPQGDARRQGGVAFTGRRRLALVARDERLAVALASGSIPVEAASASDVPASFTSKMAISSQPTRFVTISWIVPSTSPRSRVPCSR